MIKVAVKKKILQGRPHMLTRDLFAANNFLLLGTADPAINCEGVVL